MKKYKFLIIYGIIIIIALLCIMFIIPDSVFLKLYSDEINLLNSSYQESTSTEKEKKEFTDYQVQQEHLINGNYNYEYNILDSMSSTSYTYKCNGIVNGQIESGSCTSPEVISYTENSKKEALSKININYVNVEYIFNLVKEIEPELTQYTTIREYKYITKINNIETEIIVDTNNDEITQIEISNAYMTYLLKYSNINIDN